MQPLSRKDVPGLTFIFSLPEPATSFEDFAENATVTLWKPERALVQTKEGKYIVQGNGTPVSRLHYQEGDLKLPFSELVKTCVDNAHMTLSWGTVFEVRLALPMGLEDPEQTLAEDLWRLGWVHLASMDRHREPRGVKERYGYSLLGKYVSGTSVRLDIEPLSGEDNLFIGAERTKWRDRFKKS